jgi:hypothetical protein
MSSFFFNLLPAILVSILALILAWLTGKFLDWWHSTRDHD